MNAPSRSPLHLCAVLCGIALLLSTPSSLLAELYQYQGKNGEIIITTEKRRDLKLLGVINSGLNKKKPPKRAPARRAGPRTSPRSQGDAPPPSHAAKTPRDSLYDPIIREASEAYSLPFSFVKAVIKVESDFNPRAVSRVGAQGLMQLMPATAEELGVEDSFDPRQNIFGGARYLRMMTNRYNGDINMVLSAYNAGPGNVDKYSGIPFDSTQRYVRDVYRWYQSYKSQQQPPSAPATAAGGVESPR